ncbi:MAG: bifunctional 2-C-methyl-D-erythritol 4-phosphate cytidylyltransferase/2-C-methyl-D-erythritol 2,4-cyclodiphosphate synthase [Sulfurimonas sp.]|uniref:bifunctional 2-C-methyl-D-erythritol 4-phosphate cytidylyltransferase/2-C-methyl-D-erythritol 2,4-cyclodiphosphate synthase n=1 Tax=Sulfurimonas sp. TaxID=2022749 RepID=UPI0025D91888|nr:bifunctional 2-C-methyl-D-erythritol 4-phosphate cytidylyltransferase/2-C-methyl-D-erythritol 2,4-cyclodiphosphate synthase [Sulfurimonas sp.]MCK9492311.1 bifunctional 2-C-methyl-D-erythritol 4-phosphate cytidylyltransferase/2-C-methyl-D-erythritol 2,4-cyclodiphosphate synthase [Sulfurimonas sp.]
MADITLILLAAGSSSRFDCDVKKQWLRIENEPLWQFVARKCVETKLFSKIIITSSKDDIAFMKFYDSFTFVEGSTTRGKSLKNALSEVSSEYVLVSDIARPCIDESFLKSIISHAFTADCVVPYLSVNDTIVYEDKTIDREKVKRIQTPQLSKTKVLKSALDTEIEYTDESSAIVAFGGSRKFIHGMADADKITYAKDLKKLPCLTPPSNDTFVGTGFDVHAFEDKKEMHLCGVKIDSEFGFKAHSDGDVAIHALIDALLGASGMGDIGEMFPDNSDEYKNIDSKVLLTKVCTKIKEFGFVIINVDITIAAQTPRIGSYKFAMRETIAAILGCENSRVNIKATTTEQLGFIGRSEGVGVIANANLKYFDWTKI